MKSFAESLKSEAEHIASIKQRLANGEYPDEPLSCPYATEEQVDRPFCDDYGNLLTENGARRCPACGNKQYIKAQLENQLRRLEDLTRKEHHGAIRCPQDLEDTRAIAGISRFLLPSEWGEGVRRQGDSLLADCGLILTGLPGTGKTMAAICAAANLYKIWPWAQIAIWLNFGDLIASAKYGDERGGSDFLKRMNFLKHRIENADAIILDDIGRKTTIKDADAIIQDVMFRILDRAVHSRIPTILITNLHRDDLADFVCFGSVMWATQNKEEQQKRDSIRRSSAALDRLNSSWWKFVSSHEDSMRKLWTD